MQYIAGAQQTFSTNFKLVLYNQPGTYLSSSGLFAPITGVALSPYYQTGQLLAQYTAAHAPDPSLIGKFVNYSAASANAEQSVAKAILIEQWVGNNPGGLPTSLIIAWLLPNLQISGTQLAAANESADITAFLAAFTPIAPPVGSMIGYEINGVPEQVYILK